MIARGLCLGWDRRWRPTGVGLNRTHESGWPVFVGVRKVEVAENCTDIGRAIFRERRLWAFQTFNVWMTGNGCR